MSTLQSVQQKLNEHEIDAFLITNSYNRRYVTNFTGTAGVALITRDKAFFITDFRYTEQAKKQIDSFTIIEHKGIIEQEIVTLIDTLKIARLGFEAGHVTYSQYNTYKKAFSAELIGISGLLEELRMIKRDDEVTTIEKAAEIADLAYEHILSYIKPGVREREIAIELEYFMRKQGASGASFDIIVASGYRSSLPHGIASEKEIEEGELVTLDFGAMYEGYASDITRTVAVGNVSDELRTIYDVVLAAQQKGVAEIKPNMTGQEADAICRSYIDERGYGRNFGHSTGHGIGLEVHEGPTLSPRSTTVLRPNMIVTVEPGIYLPNVGGCRIEDDIVITEEGNRRLTKATKEFIQLG